MIVLTKVIKGIQGFVTIGADGEVLSLNPTDNEWEFVGRGNDPAEIIKTFLDKGWKKVKDGDEPK